ncbi:MAG: type I methionyl aminopeptidase [Gammaproteobacteria bacterium]|nr:type I methionyl aminopeptidase [Gammaproteobacteria bacterium]
MTIESQRDVDRLQRVGSVVARVLKEMLEAIEPGMTTADLDNIGRRRLDHFGARSAPQVTYNFPGATCISINEQAAHGIPGQRIIARGDVVNVDVSAELDGYFADTGGTRVVPPSTPVKDRLCHATQLALREALKEARAGNRLNRLGKAVERVARRHRLKIIRNLAGHGIGRSLHEDPHSIVGYFEPRDPRVLREGMVIAVEPFLSTRSTWVEEASDGWTLVGAKGNFSAQYEHTVIVTRGDPIVLTATASA